MHAPFALWASEELETPEPVQASAEERPPPAGVVTGTRLARMRVGERVSAPPAELRAQVKQLREAFEHAATERAATPTPRRS